MIRLTEIKLPLNHTPEDLTTAITTKLQISTEQLASFVMFKRGYDARNKRNIQLIYTLDITLTDTNLTDELLSQFELDQHVKVTPDTSYKYVGQAPKELTERPIVIGFGPCGLMAGLTLAQMGFKPIIIERGNEVRQRTKDTFGFWRQRKLNTESNVQFGEGGAGTFSDGKLYSQVKDPNHYGRKVMTEFVKAGAPDEILFVSKPHIGTYKLVSMVEKMRAEIIELGGEIRFGTRVDDIHITDDKITGVTLNNGEQLNSNHVILAVGHSARDTFQMIYDKGIYVEAKPFSVGFRIEHKQSAIDKARFGDNAGNEILGAADYKLVHHCKNGRSVYSFCMCPGGTVVAATSEENRVVTNGMSQYSRNERNANSAIVVGIDPERDYPNHPLAGIDLQRELESLAFKLGGNDYNAPAQTIGDFLKGKPDSELGDVKPSFTPGITLTDLSKALPDFAVEAIREAIPAFNKKIQGFASDDGLLTGVETRTSSPINIKRNKEFQSINTKGLFPAGEGAGYAGGILSAGIDGIKVAEAVAKSMLEKL